MSSQINPSIRREKETLRKAHVQDTPSTAYSGSQETSVSKVGENDPVTGVWSPWVRAGVEGAPGTDTAIITSKTEVMGEGAPGTDTAVKGP